MLKKFKSFIEKNNLFSPNDTVLLAVSGGADSVVLTDLMIKSNYKCIIAHCNFNLRGDESDEDEIFVMHLASKYQISFFSVDFDTKTFAKENKYSIEEAARILRYDWFNKILTQNNFDYVATGHHADDNIETFLINLTAGTGIRGLSGIKPRNNNIIRPLLFAKKSEIEEYCTKNNLNFRTDKSNFETKYVRNKFRHKIIPLFEEINPRFSETLNANINRFSEIEKIYFNAIKNATKDCVTIEGAYIKIDIKKLKLKEAPKTYLFEFLRPYNFSSKVASEIFDSLDSISGKIFFSPTHKLIKDRDYLIIAENIEQSKINFNISKEEKELSSPLPLRISEYQKTENFKISKDPRTALLDADLIKFPLAVRNWQEGDYFYPLGMTKKKLLSDFFIDQKFHLFEKEKTLLLCSGNNIIWITGKRLDNRFKITEKTVNILQINLI